MNYDLVGAMQFNLLTALGLREHHSLLDIGCGSLRAGRLFIPYLLPGRYFGIEPNSSLVQAGIANELGADAVLVKKATFSDNSSFELSVFGATFDFIVAQSIFSHTSQDQISRCMQEAARVLNPRGLFAATFIEGDEDYEGSGWVYPGRVTYRESTVTALVTEAGLGMKPLGWANPHRQRWILVGHPLHVETVSDVADPRTLKRELERCRENLTRITSHPIVRTALRARSVFRSLRLTSKNSP